MAQCGPLNKLKLIGIKGGQKGKSWIFWGLDPAEERGKRGF